MTSRGIRRVMPVLSLILALGIPGAAGAASTGPPKKIFIAVLNGGQVVPPSISNAFGVGYLTFDTVTKRVCYSISYSGMQGTETEAHLHGGETGTTNAVLYDLTPLGSPKMGCIGPITKTEQKLLLKGQMYINIHTDIFVAGELRGQVVPAPSVK